LLCESFNVDSISKERSTEKKTMIDIIAWKKREVRTERGIPTTLTRKNEEKEDAGEDMPCSLSVAMI
jgi:hypothetical protein